MRKTWNHQAPNGTQVCPQDNTSEFVRHQIWVWKTSGRLIHPEIAMEIAAWWHSPSDPGFTAFSHSGTLRGSLWDEVVETITLWKKDLDRPQPVAEDTDKTKADLEALEALWAYLEECRPHR